MTTRRKNVTMSWSLGESRSSVKSARVCTILTGGPTETSRFDVPLRPCTDIVIKLRDLGI